MATMSAPVARVLLCVALLAGSVLDAAGQATRCGPPASAVSKSGAVTQLRFANGKRVTLWGGPSSWVEAYAGCTRDQAGARRHSGGLAGRIPSRDDRTRRASRPARQPHPCAVTRACRRVPDRVGLRAGLVGPRQRPARLGPGQPAVGDRDIAHLRSGRCPGTSGRHRRRDARRPRVALRDREVTCGAAAQHASRAICYPSGRARRGGGLPWRTGC